MDNLDRLIKRHFGYLVDEYGFSMIDKEDSPQFNGAFNVRYEKDDVQIRIVRDRGQIFIDFFAPRFEEKDKEHILEELGISRKRFPTKSGLWTGYEIGNQSQDLKKYLPLILDYIHK